MKVYENRNFNLKSSTLVEKSPLFDMFNHSGLECAFLFKIVANNPSQKSLVLKINLLSKQAFVAKNWFLVEDSRTTDSGCKFT